MDGTYEDTDMNWGLTRDRCIPGDLTLESCQVNCYGSGSVTAECVEGGWDPTIDCQGRYIGNLYTIEVRT